LFIKESSDGDTAYYKKYDMESRCSNVMHASENITSLFKGNLLAPPIPILKYHNYGNKENNKYDYLLHLGSGKFCLQHYQV